MSAIANRSARTGGDGGWISLGVRTEKSPEYHSDIVVDVSPFPRALVNPDDYYKVLAAWLLPMPDGIDVRWYRSAADAERGIVGIMIPRQPTDRWPIIVAKVIEESGSSGNWIAYFERRGEHAESLTPADLQRLLRDGQRTDALAQRLDAIDDQLRALQDRQPAPPPPVGPSQALQFYRQRRNAAMTLAGLTGVPVFALTANAKAELAVAKRPAFEPPTDPTRPLNPPLSRAVGLAS